MLGAGRDTHCTAGQSWKQLQTPPRRRRHLKPLISYTFGQILAGISHREEVHLGLGGFGKGLSSQKKFKLGFFKFCHLHSGDQLVAAGGDLPPACFLPRPQPTNSQCLLKVKLIRFKYVDLNFTFAWIHPTLDSIAVSLFDQNKYNTSHHQIEDQTERSK